MKQVIYKAASGIFFDIPRIMMAGSNEFAKEIYDRFVKYSFQGQFRIAWCKKGEEE